MITEVNDLIIFENTAKILRKRTFRVRYLHGGNDRRQRFELLLKREKEKGQEEKVKE